MGGSRAIRRGGGDARPRALGEGCGARPRGPGNGVVSGARSDNPVRLGPFLPQVVAAKSVPIRRGCRQYETSRSGRPAPAGGSGRDGSEAGVADMRAKSARNGAAFYLSEGVPNLAGNPTFQSMKS